MHIMGVTSVLLAIILILLTLGFYKWLFDSWDYWTLRGIPSLPGHLPFFGNTLSVVTFKMCFAVFCKSIYDRYQGRSMIGFYNMGEPILLLRDPDLVKNVIQTNFDHFPHNQTKLELQSDPLMARDPLFARGDTWKRARINLLSVLTPKNMKNVCLIIPEICQKLVTHLNNKMKDKEYLEIEIKTAFAKYVTEITAASVFGIEGNSFADDIKGTFYESIKNTFESGASRTLRLMLTSFFPVLKNFIEDSFVPKEVNEKFIKIVEDIVNLKQSNRFTGSHVLQKLLDMEQNGRISRIEVVSHVFAFFLESFETSSLTMSSTCYYLAKNKDIQIRLRDEIETILANHEGQITYEAINEMIYLQQVISESSRFTPITGLLCKVCTKKFRLEGSDGLAVDVEPGTNVYIPSLGLHMDPKIWENPEEFNPERFTKVNIDGRHKFVHLPFGAGPRTCPGQRLGIIQAKAALIKIISNYQIEMSPKMKEPISFHPTYFLLTIAGGYWVKLYPLDKLGHVKKSAVSTRSIITEKENCYAIDLVDNQIIESYTE